MNVLIRFRIERGKWLRLLCTLLQLAIGAVYAAAAAAAAALLSPCHVSPKAGRVTCERTWS